ncbi:hypothetical protein PC128_g13193 [Phytophthora cactorum]|nr:hypothetical protein PC128_g13193 [Phytophthora cactorum]
MVHVRVVRGLALAALAIALATETQALTVDTSRNLLLGLDTGVDVGTVTNAATVAPSDNADTPASTPSSDSSPPTSTTSDSTPSTADSPSTDSTPSTAESPSSGNSLLSPVTNPLTPSTDAPTPTTVPSTSTTTDDSSTPATDAPTANSPSSNSVLSPVTNQLTPAPDTDAPSTPTATDSPSPPATDAPSVLSPVTDLLTPAPDTDAPSTPTATVDAHGHGFPVTAGDRCSFGPLPSNGLADAGAGHRRSLDAHGHGFPVTAGDRCSFGPLPSNGLADAVTDLLTPAPDTDAPSTPATEAPSILSPVTNLLTTAPATDAPLTPTSTDAPAPTSNSILSPVTNLLTTAPTTDAPTATTAPSTPATDAPASTPSSILTPITDLLTPAPTTTPSATTTPTATSVLDPITDLLTTAPTTTPSGTTAPSPATLLPDLPTLVPSATTTPTTTGSPATLLPDLPTLVPSATTTPTTTGSPATLLPDLPTLVPSATTTPTTTGSPATLLPDLPTLVPSATTTPTTTGSPATLLPDLPTLVPSATTTPSATDAPVTLIPSTDLPVTLIPSTDTPVTLTPGTESPVTLTPSTETPSTATPSTETPSSTETPATDKPSKTDEPDTSSGSSNEVTESPAPVTASPDETESPAPVTKTPTATKSPIAIETNSGSEDEQDASAQQDQTQSDVIMYNASATPITAKSGSYDPFAIPDEDKETEKPVVLNIAGDTGTSDSDLVTYVRGKTATSGSAAANNGNVIGGRNTYVDTEDSDVLSASAAAFHEFLRYASVAFAGISVALLLFFHFVSLDGNLLWVNSAWSPNTWEFLFYVGYLQQMQATSELTLLKTPYFLWDYTDSFAWSNFLLQDTSSSNAGARRLETIVLGGLVSYSDRIGISEESILNHGAVGFAVIMGILLVVFLVLAMLAKRKAERALDESSDLNSYTSGVHRLRSVSIRALGLCVLVWYFALFPLSMLASFEISMEVQASTVADSLVVAIIALVLVCFGVLAVAGRVIMHKTKDELEQFENLATWGSLYCEYTYRSRMFFVIDVVVQITTGILVGCVSGDPTQLIVVMGIQALYLACVFIMSPFADQMVLRITYVLGLLKILNFGLAFAFLNSNTMSATARTRVAQAYIGINSIVILVWFVRQLIVFSTYIRAWMVRSNDDSRRSDSVIKYDPQTDTESDLWASQFTANGMNNSRLDQSSNGATLSLPAGSSMQSMQPSYQSSTTSYGQQSMAPSFVSDAQYQQQMARKFEIGF